MPTNKKSGSKIVGGKVASASDAKSTIWAGHETDRPKRSGQTFDSETEQFGGLKRRKKD